MTDVSKPKIVFLIGPTAVGKTEIALQLAKKINAEIISCDSMQVYKGMDIGTQKPSLKMRRQVRHHMVDILLPSRGFSAADFRKRALRIIKTLHSKNKIPLFVGGTGLYMKVLIDGLFPSPPKNECLRKRFYTQAQRHGSRYLYEKLKDIDPKSAQAIHPNDTKKIVRALEVYYTAKKPISELKDWRRPLTDKFDINIFGLIMPREELYKRINERVDRMFEEGFLDEVKRLAGKKLSITAAQAIGYKEAMSFLRKQESKGMDPPFRGDDNYEGLKELIKKNTRHYAKRQLTWFRKDKRIRWVQIYGKGNISYS